jgi:hypothetical protein
MFDQALQKALTPALLSMARPLARRGVHADTLTWWGFALGLAASVAIAFQAWGLGMALLLLSRLLDGMDGALARLTQPTVRGGFLDITLDFVFYGAVVLGFALADPAANALAAAVLLTSFIGTGSSFLAYAVMARQLGLSDPAPLRKSFHYLGGFTEAGETLLVFCAMCIWPAYFAGIALGFSALCFVTWVVRMRVAYAIFKEPS